MATRIRSFTRLYPLAEKLWTDAAYAEAWNFGPLNEPNRTVHDVIQSVIKLWNKQLTITSPLQTLLMNRLF